MGKKIVAFLVLAIILLVFRNWIISYEIIGGDWPYISPEYFLNNTFLPPSWAYYVGNGLGGKIITYGLDSYLFLTFRISNFLGIPWPYGYKILWYGLFIAASGFGSYILSKKVFSNSSIHALAALIFTTNTYILMVVGGGQMGVALSYALTPFVIYFFINYITQGNIRKLMTLSLLLGLQIVFDIRIFSVSFAALCVIFWTYNQGNIFVGFFRKLVQPLFLAFTFNSFWLLPNLLNPYNPLSQLGDAYTSVKSLKFFSFATLSNSISLLHPNWPDNLFGKVAFQKPLFLLLPSIAFSSFLFTKNNKKVFSLMLIGMIGIFLGKGSNEPFGEIYVFLFEKIPIFQMFRDSTKWYLLTAVSFSLLIPFALYKVSEKVNKRIMNPSKALVFVTLIFIVVWVFMIQESLLGSLSGTFKQSYFPVEYLNFKRELLNDKNFYRTLWVPRLQRFAFSDYDHPAVEAFPLFKATDAASLKNKLLAKNTENQIKRLSIKYVVLPHDTLGEIFLDDRRYSEKERIKYEKVLDSIPYLTKVYDRNLTVYKTNSYSGLITVDGKNVSYIRKSPTEYQIYEKDLLNKKIIMVQNYNPNWVLRSGNMQITPTKTSDGFLSFKTPQNVNNLEIVFTEQNNYNKAWLLTLLALFVSLLLTLKRTQ